MVKIRNDWQYEWRTWPKDLLRLKKAQSVLRTFGDRVYVNGRD